MADKKETGKMKGASLDNSDGIVEMGNKRLKAASRTVADTADDVADKVQDTLEANPLGALAGAVAIGAAVAALVPTSRREHEALGPLAAKLRNTVGEAFDAARSAGSNELSAAGLTVAAASDGIGGIIGKLSKAATVSATAAATTVRKPRDENTKIIDNKAIA